MCVGEWSGTQLPAGQVLPVPLLCSGGQQGWAQLPCSWHGWGWHRGVVHPWHLLLGGRASRALQGNVLCVQGGISASCWVAAEESLEEQDVPLGQSVLG